MVQRQHCACEHRLKGNLYRLRGWRISTLTTPMW